MKLTVAILSIPERLHMLQNLLIELTNQSFNKPVEIIYIGDNMSISVGLKRNIALESFKGEYIAFIDDDDMIASDYIDKLLEAIKTSPDVITFRVNQLYNGKKDRVQVFQKVARRVLDPTLRRELGQPVLTMPPNHLCCWKRECIGDIRFPNKSKGEDHIWAERMYQANPLMKVHSIDEVLYIYQYNSNVTRTQKR